MKTVIGIDYSLTCPCVCVSNNKVFADNYFYFLHSSKKFEGPVINIMGDQHLDYSCEQERYENIASWVLSIIAPFDKKETEILIEDYSFGSKGRVFNLAENCGLLKYLLYKNGYSYSTVAPTVIKKYATGKGNASKEKMYEAFRELTRLDIVDIYCSKTLGSPITDIVDSYYIAMYMWDSVQNNDTGMLNRGTNIGRKVDPKL